MTDAYRTWDKKSDLRELPYWHSSAELEVPESQVDSNSTLDLGEELGQIWGTVTEGCSECDSNIGLSETQGNQVLPAGPRSSTK